PVFSNGANALLSSEGIARWLASCANEVVSLAGHTVAEVLPLEKPDVFELMSGQSTVDSARQRFHEALGRGIRLRAILITSDGKPSQRLLGIITAADLLEQ